MDVIETLPVNTSPEKVTSSSQSWTHENMSSIHCMASRETSDIEQAICLHLDSHDLKLAKAL